MWIFMNDSFLSIVEDKQNSDNFVVRARIEGDLEKVFGEQVDVFVSDTTDYRYRTFLPKELVSEVIHSRLLNIDYVNFKDSVDDADRKMSYLRVWGLLLDWQEKIYGYQNWWVNYKDKDKK